MTKGIHLSPTVCILHPSSPNSLVNLSCTSRSALLTVGLCLAKTLSKSVFVIGGGVIYMSLIRNTINHQLSLVSKRIIKIKINISKLPVIVMSGTCGIYPMTFQIASLHSYWSHCSLNIHNNSKA